MEETKLSNEQPTIVDSQEQIFLNELKYSTGKVNHLLEEIRKLSTAQNNKKVLEQLESALMSLNDTSFMLNRLPDEVSKEISYIAPKIANGLLEDMNKNLTVELNENIKRFSKEFNLSIEKCNEKIASLNTSIESINQNIESFQQSRFKKILFNLALMIFISASAAAGACYYTLTKFPQTFRIDNHTGSINVEQSRVFVEGQSTFNISKETKVIKK